jgi:hypothetical protein
MTQIMKHDLDNILPKLVGKKFILQVNDPSTKVWYCLERFTEHTFFGEKTIYKRVYFSTNHKSLAIEICRDFAHVVKRYFNVNVLWDSIPHFDTKKEIAFEIRMYNK